MGANALDWPFFTPRHRELAERLGAWREAPRDGAALLGELGAGWLDPVVPEDGYDCRALFLLRETLAEKDARADRAVLAQGMAAAPLLLAGSDEQRARLAEARRGGWRL